MPVDEDPFRFLTMVEFNRLSRREKTFYLERAAEEITRQQLGNEKDAALHLFRDAAPVEERSRSTPKDKESCG